ncbi:MAG: hypothetical protein ACD_39C01475G0002 [uncultured bacterium]|nr:MAG: hypothetical protein ACD_39C01475G0002 [uncultured bacterium]
MMAGVVLPSAAVLLQKSRLENLVYRCSVLCREAFERAVFAGRQYQIVLQAGELKVFRREADEWQPVNDVWLRAPVIPGDCQLDWPADGWTALPEGYCESPQLRFHDVLANQTIFIKIRPYDAHFVRESQLPADAAGKL